MKKTIITVFSVLSIFSFGLTAGAVNGNDATNGVGNVVEGAGDVVGGVVRGAGNVVEGVADGVGNVVEGVAGGTGATNGANTNDIIADSNIINDQDRLNANTRTDLPNDRTTETEITEGRRERNPSTGVPIAGFVTITAVALGTIAAVSKKRK